jgi:hypothetical protein
MLRSEWNGWYSSYATYGPGGFLVPYLRAPGAGSPGVRRLLGGALPRLWDAAGIC